MIGGVVLAAGAGRRFGGRKQLADLNGRPLLQHALDAMLAVPAIERVVVVLGADALQIAARLDLSGVEAVVCEEWEQGVSASLRTGVGALPEANAVVVTLGDEPLITPQVIAAIVDLRALPEPAARAVYEGRPGHPVLIKRELFPALAGLRGERGARELLVEAGAMELECGHLCRPDDVNTPEDLEAIA